MKRLFNIVNLFIVAVLLSVNTVNAQVTLDYESGSKGADVGNCWGFGGINYVDAQNLKISGSWSGQSAQLTNPSPSTAWIKSPWMKVGAGIITISTELTHPQGTTRQLVASYIPYDVNAVNSEGTPKTFFTYNYPKNGNAFSVLEQNLEIPIPVAIANSSDTYKIRFSFAGTDGNSRAISDNIIIPGTYYSDPAKSCSPISEIVDTDNDGVADTEEEYPNDITRAYNNYFPSANTFGTLAFEDNWPSKGDYDLNDIVVDYKINRVTNAQNNVVEVIATFVAKASGAGFQNAFGFQLDNIEPNKIVSVTGNKVGTVADFIFELNGLESGQQYANIIVFDNFYKVLKHPGSGSFINVTKGAPFVDYVTLTVTITMQSGVQFSELPADKFNFYIVADVLKKGRGKEIHLPDGKPSSKVDNSLFGTFDDNSAAPNYYRTVNNLPWGINVVQGFDYMFEKLSIDKGYNYFINWAESSGTQYPDWFEDNAGYRNPENIYEP